MRGAAVALLAIAACRSAAEERGILIDAPPPDAAALFDAPDGTGCTPTTPRTAAPELFIGPSGLSDRLVGLIDSAQRSLELQMYLFDDPTLEQHVAAAHARGVNVRVLLDPTESGNDQIRPLLVTAGVDVRSTPPVFTYAHAKYMILDGATGVVMSMNFNTDAMTSERNYGFVEADPDDVADLQRIFSMDWAAAGAQTPRPANLGCTRLFVSPDNSKLRVLALIDGAQATLDVEAQYLSDPAIRGRIEAAALRGVAVRVILEDPDQQSGNDTEAAELAAVAAIPVHYATSAQFYVHAKLLIADGVAFVGSENYSETSLTQNREVGALLFEPAVAAAVQAQFDADWPITVPAS